MSKRSRKTTPRVIEERIRAGRGEGRGANYKSWLYIQDVASQGLVTRVMGWKTQRMHGFLSKLETSYFYALEWALVIHDIREQFPLLPLDETLLIAEQCGVKHPTDPKTGEAVALTTDFLVTVSSACGRADQARTVKYVRDLSSKRVLEKLEIERRYWQRRGIDWGIVTERDISTELARNVELVHGYRDLTDRLSLTQGEIEEIADELTDEMARGTNLRSATTNCDQRFYLERGTSLAVAYHLIATRQWRVDMSIPIQPGKQLILLAMALAKPCQDKGGVA